MKNLQKLIVEYVKKKIRVSNEYFIDDISVEFPNSQDSLFTVIASVVPVADFNRSFVVNGIGTVYENSIESLYLSVTEAEKVV